MKRIGIVIIALSGFFCGACSRNKAEEKSENKKIKEEFLSSISTQKAELSDRLEELTLTGKVEYDPDRVINYVSLISGVVEKTYFSLGDKVQKGQPLADIRSTELSMLQSELISLQSESKIAERELKMAKDLYQDNMLSEKELLEAEAKLNQTKASLKRIEMDMSLYGYNPENNTFSIKAPMSGYIVAKDVSSGSTISNDGNSLFTVADLSNVWITANVYPSNLMFVKEGMDVKITALSYPEEVFDGKINTLSQVFDPEEKVLKARIVMSNSEMKFKPEMAVVVKLQNQSPKQLVAVPSDALIFDNNRYFVVVGNNEKDFTVREVAMQGKNKDISYIASGLDEGESIVTKNQLLIYSQLQGKS